MPGGYTRWAVNDRTVVRCAGTQCQREVAELGKMKQEHWLVGTASRGTGSSLYRQEVCGICHEPCVR
jgi:hypothetical protein